MSDILNEICAAKREHIASQKVNISASLLLEKAKAQPAPRGFIQGLKNKGHAGHFGLIAEIKKASPSAGLIRQDFNPESIAKAYEAGGAACLSVLTDTPYFQGKDAYVKRAKDACNLPVLRKDFMLDPYQITESRALGADCILLIMAALSDMQAAELHSTAAEHKMDVLVEVHNHEEMQRALKLNPAMLGINNRNLKTMTVDLAISESLAADIPDDCVRVCESGIAAHNDLLRMQKSGITHFLVGESLMRQHNITQATQELLGLNS